jgi:hypothetical protein
MASVGEYGACSVGVLITRVRYSIASRPRSVSLIFSA